MKNYLLMTATVTPLQGEIVLTRTDPALRLNDYIAGFKFYLNQKNSALDGIVFVENSHHHLNEIKQLVETYQGNMQLEVISFAGLDYPVEYNRGFGELKLIEYAMQHSAMLKSMTANDRFWKVTGRLKVLTLPKIIQSAPHLFDVYADFRRNRSQVDTRLIAFSKQGYQRYIFGKSLEMVGMNVETWLFKKLTPLLNTPDGAGIFTEFRVVPMFDGFAGYGSANYMSLRQKAIYGLRSVYLTAKYFFPLMASIFKKNSEV